MFPEPQGDLKDRVVNREIATDTTKPARALCVRAFFFKSVAVTLVVSEATFCCLS